MNNEFVFLLGTAVPAGRLFGLDQQTLISIVIQLLNVCILAVALSYILYKPVQDFMGKRTDRIIGQLNNAQEKVLEANALKAEYEKKLQEIDIERLEILNAARVNANDISKHILEEARHEAATIRKRTEESILIEKERLKQETRQYIIEISALMAGKFVEQTIDGDAQNKLFDETIAELEEASWLN